MQEGTSARGRRVTSQCSARSTESPPTRRRIPDARRWCSRYVPVLAVRVQRCTTTPTATTPASGATMNLVSEYGFLCKPSTGEPTSIPTPASTTGPRSKPLSRLRASCRSTPQRTLQIKIKGTSISRRRSVRRGEPDVQDLTGIAGVGFQLPVRRSDGYPVVHDQRRARARTPDPSSSTPTNPAGFCISADAAHVPS